MTQTTHTTPDNTSDSRGQICLEIKGLHCEGCVTALSEALLAQQNVKAATVTLEPARAVVTCDTTKLDRKNLISLIEKAGFEAY